MHVQVASRARAWASTCMHVLRPCWAAMYKCTTRPASHMCMHMPRQHQAAGTLALQAPKAALQLQPYKAHTPTHRVRDKAFICEALLYPQLQTHKGVCSMRHACVTRPPLHRTGAAPSHLQPHTHTHHRQRCCWQPAPHIMHMYTQQLSSTKQKHTHNKAPPHRAHTNRACMHASG